MNNKVLCKKIENLRNTVHVRFPANGKYPKLISNPSFVPQKHLGPIHETKKVETFNKPVYVSRCILELNKSLTFDSR